MQTDILELATTYEGQLVTHSYVADLTNWKKLVHILAVHVSKLDET